MPEIKRHRGHHQTRTARATARRAGTSALVAALLVASSAVTAGAIVDGTTTGIQTLRQNPPSSIGGVRASLHLDSMRAGEVHELRASSAIGYSAPDRNFIGQKITCENAEGRIVQQIWNGQNLLKSAVEAKLASRMLFVAPVAGSYDCRLRVYVRTHTVIPAVALLRSGSITDLTGDLGDVATVGRAPYVSKSAYFRKGSPKQAVQQVPSYQPPGWASRFVVTGDAYVTVCYGNGGSTCPTGVSYPPSGESLITHSLVAIPSNTSCPIVRSTPRTERLTSAVHHQRYMAALAVTVPAGVDCGTWRSMILVSHAGGIPFVVHNSVYSTVYITPKF